MFYSQVILAKKGPLAKVWLAAHWGDKKLARPQIFATDISQSCVDVMNPSVPLALRLSGHLLLGIVRIYSRKVKYVLNDCTEAMLKLQMAFATGTSSTGKDGGNNELLTDADAPAHQLVANFGEFDQVHVVEGFCLPLPEDNEWILADEAQWNKDLEGNNNNNTTTDLLTLPTSKSQQRSASSTQNHDEEDDEEEQWAPFDPDNEDEDDEDNPMEGLPRNSHVSEIEIVRAGGNNDSMLSDDPTRPSTSLLDGSTLTENAPSTAHAENTTTNNNEEDDYDFGVPFEDDSEDEAGKNTSNNNSNSNVLAFGDSTDLGDSQLRLSTESGLATAPNTSGLAMDDDDDDEFNDSRTKRPSDQHNSTATQQPRRKRRRKRRKVVIDNHDTELTNEHIRSMLQDTDDIVCSMLHPASLWDEEEDDGNHKPKDYQTLVVEDRRKRALDDKPTTKPKAQASKVPSLTQPFLEDPGVPLNPLLQQLWKDNYWKALGQPCPYQRLDPTTAADDVETVRRDASTQNDDTSTVASDLKVTTNDDNDGDKNNTTTNSATEEPPDDGFDFPPPVDDDDEEEEDMDAPVPDFDDESETNVGLQTGTNNDDLLDLGLVNDMVLDSDDEGETEDQQARDNDDEDTHRQAAGSSSTKWHKHTVRVFSHLKKCLGDNTDSDSDNNNEPPPDEVDFHELTKHMVSRRNASSVFFEMLQLKTWDFIELDQDEPYGSIAVSKGARFDEEIPKD